MYSRIQLLFLLLLLTAICMSVHSQDIKSQPQRVIQIKLKTGETLIGNLVKVDPISIDFTVKGILQTVSVDDAESVIFVKTTQPVPISPPSISDLPSSKQTIEPMKESLRPTVTYKEKAKYTDEARDKGTEGTVILNVVFTADQRITNIRVIRGLPDGLTEAAIEAARKIQFIPAMKDGIPINVRGNLEFTFSLYTLPPPILIAPENNQIFHYEPRTVEERRPRGASDDPRHPAAQACGAT